MNCRERPPWRSEFGHGDGGGDARNATEGVPYRPGNTYEDLVQQDQ
jgi:hypothetical protein